MRRIGFVATVGIALAACGCLQMDTDTTFYLEPDGTLELTHVQRNVRSDEKTAEAREIEEQTFIERARAGWHGPALALHELGASDVQTRVLRERRPFNVETTATFGSIADPYRAFLELSGLPGEAELGRRGDRMRFTFTMHEVDRLLDEETGSEEELVTLDTLSTLLFDAGRILLTAGTFVDAEGFEIDGPQAVPLEIDEEGIRQDDGTLRLMLEWTSETGAAG
jgi:hypothetical protein